MLIIYAVGGIVQLYMTCYCMQQLLDVVSFDATQIFTCAHYIQKKRLN